MAVGLELAAAVALVAAVVVACRPTWVDILASATNDPNSGQIWLAPLVMFCLAAVRLPARESPKRSAGRPDRPAVTGLLLLAGGWLAWRWGFWAGRGLAWHGGAVAAAVGTVVVAIGPRAARRFAPALVAAAFLVPVSNVGVEQVSGPLQTFAAAGAQAVATLLGMVVARDGNILHINGIKVEVAEACSGLRGVFSLILASYLAGFLQPARWWVRATLLAASPVVAVAANVVRLVPTLWMFGHHPGDAARAFHDAAGWAMLVGAFAANLQLARLCEWVVGDDRSPAARRRGVGRSAAAAASAPMGAGGPGRAPASTASRPPSSSWWYGSVAIAALLVVGMTVDARAMPTARDLTGYHDRVAAVGAAPPGDAGPWVEERDQAWPDPVLPERLNLFVRRSYRHRDTGRQVRLLITQVRDTRDCIGHFSPNCFASAGWAVTATAPARWQIGDVAVSGAAFVYDATSRRPAGQTRATLLYALLVPDGRSGADVAMLNDRSVVIRDRTLGAAQVQLMFTGDPPAAERDGAMRDILMAHRPLVELLAKGLAK
ncbi:MAG TPA: exosortase/archaeosortase family protein [Humisphaera sp.]